MKKIFENLMENKNHDYDEAWRNMRISSLTDLILQKILRIKQIEDNVPFLYDSYSDYLSWFEQGRDSYDVHCLYDSRKSRYLGNAVLIDNMVGASKILGMYSDFISEDQQDYLRYQKPYNGETTLINLTENAFEEDGSLKYVKNQWHQKF